MPGKPGQLLDVGLGARADLAEDDLLGDAAAERNLDLREYLRLEVAEPIGVGGGERHTERHPARDDRDLAHGVGAGCEHPDDCVAALVVGRPATILGTHQHLAFGAEDDPLERVSEVGFLDHVVLAPRSRERRLVHQVGEVGSDHPRCRRGDACEVDVGPERDAARVYPEDRLAPITVWRLDRDPAVEPSRPKECLVEHVGPVGRADHDHVRRRVEPVHLGQDLVQRLLALVVAAAEAGHAARPRAADRVELVDEDDCRRVFLRLLEEVTHARGADSYDRLDELGRGNGEERNVRLPGDGARKQRLPRAGRPGKQDAVRDPAAHLAVLVRVAQEVDDLAELVLDLLDAGDVGERHFVA